MRVLGISAFQSDSAAALVEDGHVVAAAQEERFSRRRFDPGPPLHAAAWCLGLGQGGAADLTVAAGDVVPEDGAIRADPALCRAAAAFYPSPFAAAAVLVVDGALGTALGVGRGANLELATVARAPHAIGLFYSALSAYLGFRVNSGEYKVMGLAPYGTPRHVRALLDQAVDLSEDGALTLNPAFFAFGPEGPRVNDGFADLFGHPPRCPDDGDPGRFHMDMAASLQAVTEQAVLRLARRARRETGERVLCLAGTVALNCVANGRLKAAGIFDDLWVQPASGPAGGALGAALLGYHQKARRPRPHPNGRDGMAGALLGPAFAQPEIETRLTALGARFQVLDDGALIERVARALAAGQAVGWVQGRMEFGPRALGNRSILADPRAPAMQKILNLKVKFRESFRPFAPAVLAEDTGEWFMPADPSPYMALVSHIRPDRRLDMPDDDDDAAGGLERLARPRSAIPAVTHVDCSARLQTVAAADNPRFHALLAAFKGLTGCGVLVNTSFNVRGEPIVCTPEDAFRCFMGCGIDLLAVGNCLLAKPDQDPALAADARGRFAPD